MGVQWDLVPVPHGFPGSSQPSVPAVHDPAAFRSSSCCLRVIHRPQPLMDSIQLLLPHPPRHCDSCSGWKQIPFGSESPRYFIFTHHFLSRDLNFSLLSSPVISFQLYPRSDGVMALAPSPTFPSPHAADGVGCWIHPLLQEWAAWRCWHCSFSAVFTAARSKVHVAVDAVYR